MQTSTLTITFALSTMLAVGCDYEAPDGCDPSSPLYPGLTQAQKDACEDGTGDEDDTDDFVWCFGPPVTDKVGGSTIVVEGINKAPAWCWHDGGPADEINNLMPIKREYCDAATMSWPLISLLGETVGYKMYCTLMDLPADSAYPNATTAASRLCDMSVGGEVKTWMVAAEAPDPMVGDTWASGLTCGSGTDAGVCPLGVVAYHTIDDMLNDTCRCDGVDDDCQAGAVCEGGFVLDGLHPHPTVCRPYDAQGNPIKPGGPAAYQLARWSDGIDVYDSHIMVTPAMVHGAWGLAGLWNDTQKFDSDGLITWCADDSLCAWLGLAKDDRVDIELLDLSRLAFGGVVPVTIEHADGAVEEWTLSLE